jgi:hypothetical protein
MTEEEISRRAKEKFIKAKKEFKDGDFFKVACKGETIAIGCFESIDSDSYSVNISCHFFCFAKVWARTSYTNYALRIDFDTQDLIKASPQEAMFVVGKLKYSGCYYDRKARKVKNIGFIGKNGKGMMPSLFL